MKTAIDKDESELDRMKRESLEWLERWGKKAQPFITIAINNFGDQFTEQETPLPDCNNCSKSPYAKAVPEVTDNEDEIDLSNPDYSHICGTCGRRFWNKQRKDDKCELCKSNIYYDHTITE